MDLLRTMACLETKTTTLLQIEPGKAVEVAADTASGHWHIYMCPRILLHVRACVYIRPEHV